MDFQITPEKIVYLNTRKTLNRVHIVTSHNVSLLGFLGSLQSSACYWPGYTPPLQILGGFGIFLLLFRWVGRSRNNSDSGFRKG